VLQGRLFGLTGGHSVTTGDYSGGASQVSLPHIIGDMEVYSPHTLATMGPGEKLFYERCTLCHVPRGPGDFSKNQWQDITPTMFQRAGLDEAQRRTVLDFLLQSLAPSGLFAVRHGALALGQRLAALRADGATLAQRLGERGTLLLGAGGRSIEQATGASRLAADRGMAGFLAVAALLFAALLLSLWLILRSHLVGRLQEMESLVRSLGRGDLDVVIRPMDRVTRWHRWPMRWSSSAAMPASAPGWSRPCSTTRRPWSRRCRLAPPNSAAATCCWSARWPNTRWRAARPRKPTGRRTSSSVPSATSCARRWTTCSRCSGSPPAPRAWRWCATSPTTCRSASSAIGANSTRSCSTPSAMR
jgi:hypothetical protein